MISQQRGDYDIGSILSEMREAYWSGLAEQEEELGEVLECLVFTLGGERFAFETHFAAEVLRVPKLIRVPAVQDSVVGIFNLRGEITAAMDVRPLLGLDQPQLGAKGRILVVKSERFATGIMVEAAHGVQGLSLEHFEPAPPGTSATRFVRGHFDIDGKPVILLDLAALLDAPEMLIGEGA